MNTLNHSNVKGFVNAETDEKAFAITPNEENIVKTKQNKIEIEITFEEVEWLYRKMKLINKHCK